MKPGVFETPADVDRVVHAPELVDVAHQVDVGADALAHHAHALEGDVDRRLAPALHLHLAEAHVSEPRAGLRQIVDRVRTHQGAARVRRDARAQPAEQRAHRLAHRLALEIPARHVDGGQCERIDAAGPRVARGAPALRSDRLDLRGIVADDELAQRLHRGLERGRERAAEERDADPGEPLIRAELERDELTRVGGRGKADDERVVGRRAQHPRGDVRDLHHTLLTTRGCWEGSIPRGRLTPPDRMSPG